MKILIANDGSECGNAAVKFASQIAGGADVMVLTVIEPASTLEVETMIESVEELEAPDNPEFRRANDIGRASVSIINDAASPPASVEYAAKAGPAARTIVETAETWGADMIVLGTHGQGFWQRALVGSVADRVVHHAHCTVMIVRRPSAE